MCQLTLVSSKDIDYRAFLALELLWNSSTTNKDGWGFFNPAANILYKDEKEPDKDKKLLSQVSHIPYGTTTMAHVRASSTMKDNIKKENSHPFDKKNIVLAHNGTLLRKDGIKPLNIIDSEDFANELDKELDSEPDFQKAITNVYTTRFKGKFAFLVYYKKEKAFYVAKGQTAFLSSGFINYTTFDNKELSLFIVNTLEEPIHKAVMNLDTFMISMGYVTGPGKIQLKELEINSLFKFDEETLSLKKIGELKEEIVNYIAENTAGRVITPFQPFNYASIESQYSKEYEKNIIDYKKLGNLLGNLNITFDEFCVLIKLSTPKGIHNLVLSADIGLSLMKVIVDKFSWNKLTTWTKIKKISRTEDILSIYRNNNLEFPYYLNTEEELTLTLNSLIASEATKEKGNLLL